jgi:hypothetical protein
MDASWAVADLEELPRGGGSGRGRRTAQATQRAAVHPDPEEPGRAAGAEHPSATAEPPLLPRTPAAAAARVEVPQRITQPLVEL